MNKEQVITWIKDNKLPIIIVAGIVLLLGSAFFSAGRFLNPPKLDLDQLGNGPYSTPYTNPYSYSGGALPEFNWVLNDKAGSKLVGFSANQYTITTWGDEVIFAQYDEAPNATLHSYNLKTKRDTVLFNSRQHSLEITSKSERVVDAIGIQSLSVIDNTLYIGIGEYMVTGGLFWVDLSTKERTVHLLATGQNPRIKEYSGSYWIKGGDGDGCGSWSELSPVNLQAKTVGSSISYGANGCPGGQGDIFLGISSKQTAVFYHYTVPDSEPSETDSSSKPANVNVVYEIDPTKPEVKTPILDQDTIDAKTTAVVMDQKNQKLLLFGYNNIHVFSLDKRQYVDDRKVTFPWGSYPHELKEGDTTVCLSSYNNNESTYFTVDLNKYFIEKNAIPCYGLDDSISDIEKNLSLFIKKFPGYSLTKKHM
ncbi:MAG: hypothetical protein WC045_04245 [Patescibacteria group bacterium]